MRKLTGSIIAVVVAGFLCGASPGAAQDCKSETILQLWSSIVAQKAVVSELQENDTGSDPGAIESDTSKTSFLPFLRFAFNQLGLLAEDQNSFSISQKIPLGLEHLEFNLQGRVQEPQIYEPLKNLLPEEGQQARIDDLLADLDESDDFTLTLASNLLSKYTGRGVNVYGALFSQLTNQLQAESVISDKALLAFTSTIADITRDPLVPEITENTDLCTLDEDDRQRLREHLLLAAKEEAEAEKAVSAEFARTGLSSFYKLIDNQPQLHLTAAYRWRDELLGPSGLSAKLTFEYGFANVNTLRGKAKNADAIKLAEYREYILNPRTQVQLERDDRVTASLEYLDDRRDRIVLPQDGIDLALGGTTKKWNLIYGRSLAIAADRQVLSRVDLSAGWEDVSDDPQRQDRGVGTVTYTARVRDPWFLTLVLNYANHAKFLPESDEDFGAHIGVSYKLFSKDPNQ